MRLWVGLMIAAGFLLASTPALAGDPRDPVDPIAKEHLVAGGKLYKKGDKESAILHWEKGLAREEAPWLLFNLGQAHAELGRIKQAVAYFERLAKSDRLSGAQRAQVSARVEELRKQLPPEPPPREPKDDEPAAPELTPIVSPEPDELITSPHPEGGGRFRDPIAWTLFGGGVVLGVAAGGFALSATGLDSEADRTEDNAERMRLRDRADSRSTTAVVLAVTGAVTLIAGIVKFAIYKEKSAPRGRRLGVAFGSASIALEGRF